MTSVEYLRTCCCVLVTLVTAASSLPSSYLSSMAAGGDGGMTWMGWAPQTGMTAFASSANPWPNQGWTDRKQTGIELEPPSPGASPASAAEDEDEKDTAQEARPSKKWNKPRNEEDELRPGTSNAQASLNAWFPIMLGLFPPQDSRNQQADQGWESGPSRSITAVANSVNHGSKGVASSHSVAYGGEPPNSYTRSRGYKNGQGQLKQQEQYRTGHEEQRNANGQNLYGNGQQKNQQQYKQLSRYANTSY